MEGLGCFVIILCACLEVRCTRGDLGINKYSPSSRVTTFDVTKFGAIGDAKTDDSKAFTLAWTAACQKVGDVAKISVPLGKRFLVSPIEFGGPCKSQTIMFEILGSIIAQPKLAWKNTKEGQWLRFRGVDKLRVLGNEQGLIDGQGHSWWPNSDNARPTAMSYSNCSNLEMSGLKHINSPKFHVSIAECNNATISRLHIIAPPQSPNTDGIDLLSSTNIHILNCTIETGDDCIAIKGGTSNVTISDIACGPGHGISIGSLGQNGAKEQVEAISVSNCILNRTQNGVRIKTWQGGFGFARNINFSHINFIMADNPVVINQFYCPHNACINKTSAVNVSDVRYNDLYGTTGSSNAIISFRCSDTIPCTNIMVDGVNIGSKDPNRDSVSVVCVNAHGTARNATTPSLNCLQK